MSGDDMMQASQVSGSEATWLRDLDSRSRMIVRVQSKNGTRRIDAQPSESLKTFLGKVIQEFQLDARGNFSLFQRPGHRGELTQKQLQLSLGQIPIRHGDMLFLSQQKDEVENDDREGGGAVEAPPTVEEDEVDKLVSQKDGKIYRKKDPQLCRHGTQAGCVNCAPLEPWDPKVLDSRDPPIKHLSFHCYLRKLTSGVDRGKFVYLEDLSCKIKPGCTDHPQWPEGICTKCQPSAISLSRQPYRHVDNVMFEDSKIVDRFIEGWRRSGCQRIGYLYGTYQEYTEVPLGIKAVVAAIYEPPQVSQRFSVELLEDSSEKQVEDLAAMLGLRRVGWIFTDLEPDATKKTMVAYKRSIHTHVLSAEECIMVAEFQNSHPNPCKVAKSGYFGSKFVTVCVSGNELKQVDLKGYQVSNQCMALVRDDCLVPTLDAPELGYIRESTPEQYVPDVFYKTKGEYGEVTKLGRPLPLEYLIIELTTSTPVNPQPLLVGGKEPPFLVENRTAIGGAVQDFSALSAYLGNQQSGNFLCSVSDFHLLLFLYTNEVAGFDFKPHLPELCRAIREQSRPLADQWRYREPWATVEQLILASISSPTQVPGPPVFPPTASTGATGSGGGAGSWSCKHCTLLNPANVQECEACNLPKDS